MEFILKLTLRDCVVPKLGECPSRIPGAAAAALQDEKQPEDGRRRERSKKGKEERDRVREMRRASWMFKYILDFSSLDFTRLSDGRRCYSLRDLAIMQNFPGLLRSYGLSHPPALLVFVLPTFHLFYCHHGQPRLCFTSSRLAF